MQKHPVGFVKDQIQKHYLKIPVLFPHTKHFFPCFWIMPINILIHPGIAKKVLLYFLPGTMQHDFKGLSSTQIWQGLFVIMFWKAALPLCSCTVLLAQGSGIPSQPLCSWEKEFFTELLPASLCTSNYIYCYTYFFSFCGFYPKSLQLMGKVPWPPRDFIYSSFHSVKKCWCLKESWSLFHVASLKLLWQK